MLLHLRGLLHVQAAQVAAHSPARNVCNCSARLGPGLANWRRSVQDVVDELEDKVIRTFPTFLGGVAQKDSPTSRDNLIYTPTECLDRFS
jgi:hypothetical protein